jgi:hypothetical protein
MILIFILTTLYAMFLFGLGLWFTREGRKKP